MSVTTEPTRSGTSTQELLDNSYVELSSRGRALLISHPSYPFIDSGAAESPYTLAVAYLRALMPKLGLTVEEIDFLEGTLPGTKSGEPSTEASATPLPRPLLNWRQLIEQPDGRTVIVLIEQTVAWSFSPSHGTRGPQRSPIAGAGLRIVMHRRPGLGTPSGGALHASSVTSTLRDDFTPIFAAPASGPTMLETLSPDGNKIALNRSQIDEVLANFGFGRGPEGHDRAGTDSVIIAPVVIHRFSGAGEPRVSTGGKTVAEAPEVGVDYPAAVFRLIPSNGKAGADDPASPPLEQPAYDLTARLFDFAPLDRRALLTSAMPPVQNGTGKVFTVDPISATGDWNLLPNAPDARLNPVRQDEPLLDLFVPQGMPQIWELSGPGVKIDGLPLGPPYPCGGIGYSPPTPPLPEFDYDARTNEFAAVNAYFHLANMTRMLETFGIPLDQFPAGFQLPLRVLHRSSIFGCPDGNCVDAQVLIIPNQAPPGPLQCDPCIEPRQQVRMRFALADLMLNPGALIRPLSPLGIACDVRIVWHEFCHALIAAATDQLEFPFAHSAGDALAAINCDVQSVLAQPQWQERYRGVTFPWAANATRRHDREAFEGWSWVGPLGTPIGYHHDVRDIFGYAREQVLSSTLFRLYGSIDGDADDLLGEPDPIQRKAAAEYATYLIVAAIRSLGNSGTVPSTVEEFADALMQADVGCVTLATPAQTAIAPMGRVGGTVYKVVRWAFEKQGLYRVSGQPAPGDGSGNPPKIDVYIDDGRAGEYEYRADWQAIAVWNRVAADGGTAHQDPVANQDNFLYVTVSNRGYQAATDATVSIWAAAAAVGPPRVWPDAGIWTNPPIVSPPAAVIANGGTTRFGPFMWRPNLAGKWWLMSAVDATGDLSSVNPTTSLPAATITGLIEWLVPFDNNLGFNEWLVV